MAGDVKPADPVFELLTAWDELDSAVDRIVTALPGQMTTAAERLEAERLRFRHHIRAYAFNLGKPRSQP